MKKLPLSALIATLTMVNSICTEKIYAEDSKGSLTLALENDLFGAGTDEHYTHGTEITYVSDTYQPAWLLKAASLLPFYKTNADTRLVSSLGQQIYTPADITAEAPQPNDRPYAGWLYTSFGLVTDNRAGSHYVDKLEFVLGLVGPDSGAESVQKTVHKWIGSKQPEGWDNQYSQSVSKNSWVGEIQAGFVLGWENWRATLTEIMRSREFEHQVDPDEYGAIAVSYRF